jgi:hypothetical protein
MLTDVINTEDESLPKFPILDTDVFEAEEQRLSTFPNLYTNNYNDVVYNFSKCTVHNIGSLKNSSSSVDK